MDYVDLNRRFVEINEKEELDPDTYQSLAGLKSFGFLWEDLLKKSRVVILAEAGMGKTEELKAQTRKLRKDGKYAFFCRIEDLAEEGLVNSLDIDPCQDEELFEDWQRSSQPGYFFLDSVDEARLNGQSFEKALRKLAKALGSSADSVFIFVTSRISDWQPETDLVTFNRLLPPPSTNKTKQTETDTNSYADTELLARVTTQDKVSVSASAVVVELGSLDAEQQRRLARAAGVPDPDTFVDAIRRADINVFAGRPQDLLELAAYWSAHRKFGSLKDMHEFNIRIKLREQTPERSSQSSLPEDKMLEGVEMLAAALALCRKSSLLVPDRQIDPQRTSQALDAQNILTGWQGAEIAALLRTAIFDQQTYGRLRFHHRSIREYLTGRWFKRLLASNAPYRAIAQLLFREQYGEQVIVPSLRPVASWLGQWDERFRNHLLKVAPEVLIEDGDPSQLSVESRATLLKHFAKHYANRGQAYVGIYATAVKRLAHSDLAPTILELLDQYRNNETICELLLKIIWQGRITACTGVALEDALDRKVRESHRILGVRCIGAAGSFQEKERLARAILSDILNWNQKILGEAIIALFPEVLSVKELVQIITQTSVPNRDAVGTGLRYALEEVIAGKHLKDEEIAELFENFFTLIRQEPHLERVRYPISEKFSWLLPHIAQLTELFLKANSNSRENPKILQAIELIGIGRDYRIVSSQGREAINRLQEHIAADHLLNRALFWHSVQRRREQIRGKLTLWFQAQHFGQVWTLEKVDFDAFAADISSCSHLDDRQVALSAAFAIWNKLGKDYNRLRTLQKAVEGQATLETLLTRLLNPTETEEERQWREEQEERERELEQQQQRNEEREQAFIHCLQQNPQRLRDHELIPSGEVFNDLHYLVDQMREAAEGSSQWAQTNWQSLVSRFGRDVAEAARDGLQQFWRTYTPPVRSEKEIGNRTSYGTVAGLSGLGIESQLDPSWAVKLSQEEATLAARYATEELNGFPEWLEDLLTHWPNVVVEVFFREIEWEFNSTQAEVPHHVLAVVTRESGSLCNRFVHIVWQLLKAYEPYHLRTLDNALTVLLSLEDIDRKAFAELAGERFQIAEDEDRKLTWLVALLFVEADTGVEALRTWIEESSSQPEQDRRMLAFCNAMMEHHSLRFGSFQRDFARIEILGDLLNLVYSHIRPEEDNNHEGVYSPDDRDNAETTRNFLVQCLVNTPGRASYEMLKRLAVSIPSLPERLQERFQQLAQDRAAKDADLTLWLPNDVAQFARTYTIPPRAAKDLFQLVLNRLDDLRHDLEGGDANEARLLASIKEEALVQNWFAARLRSAAHGFYSVSREEEVADFKKPDIRVHSPSIDSPVSIEIKVADNWSYSELCERLENQLITQYHRDRHSRFGVYLLTYHGDKKYRMTNSKPCKNLSFSQLISNLQQYADELVKNRNDIDELQVVGVNVSNTGRS
jgi:hypothetical protein